MTRPEHIFIVGLARTGSTLTRSILNASDAIYLAGESRYFRDVPRLGFPGGSGFRHTFAKVGDISTDAGARKVVEYIFSIREQGFWNLRVKNFDAEEFLRRLLESDRSERSLLDLAMIFYADNKPMRGEKTPAHIYFVPTLLEWFPNAKIIHTFRDPRAIYVSNKRKSARKSHTFYGSILRKLGLFFELYSSTNTILTWHHVIRLHQRYQRRYPDNYRLFKYEDLITDPQGSVQKLCEFSGVAFTPDMLQQTVVNSSYLPKGGKRGFDTTAIDRWRAQLHPLINRWFVLWCKGNLVKFGYQP